MPNQDPSATGTGVATPTPDVSDNGTPQPAPMPAVGPSPSETRYQQQLEGQRPIIEALLSAGLKTPDDIARAAKAMENESFFADKGVDSDVFRQLYPDTAIPQEDQPLTRKDLESLKNEMESQNARRLAEAEYKRLEESSSSIHSGLVSDLSTELFGESHDPFLNVLLDKAVGNIELDYRDVYGEDHPFRDERLMPLTTTSAESLKAAILKQRDDLKAQALAATGDAARQSSSQTVSAPPAGRATGQGKPDSAQPKPLSQLTRLEKIKWLENRAKQKGGPTSA